VDDRSAATALRAGQRLDELAERSLLHALDPATALARRAALGGRARVGAVAPAAVALADRLKGHLPLDAERGLLERQLDGRGRVASAFRRPAAEQHILAEER